MRRKKDEVEKFLPSKKQVILKCDLSAWQKVYYQQVTSEGRVGLDSGMIICHFTPIFSNEFCIYRYFSINITDLKMQNPLELVKKKDISLVALANYVM